VRTEELTVWTTQTEEVETKGCKAGEVKDEPDGVAQTGILADLPEEDGLVWKERSGGGGSIGNASGKNGKGAVT
jgi:hypothetical protein